MQKITIRDGVLREKGKKIILVLTWAVVGRGREGIEKYFTYKEAFVLGFEG